MADATSGKAKNIDFFAEAAPGVRFIEGGLTRVRGLAASAVRAGFRANSAKDDLALVSVPAGATAAGVFTTNRFCAAPVRLSREHLANQTAKALVINSGNANAATGGIGYDNAVATAQMAARLLGVEPDDVLVASTGVIGVQMDMGCFERGLPQAVGALGADDGTDAASGLAAARAIMTTDTVPKQAAVEFTAVQSDGLEVTYRIGGMSKGSGMIEPHLATMIAVVATDAAVQPDALERALQLATRASFNRITIDSDMSTNDSLFLLATGAATQAAGGRAITLDCPVFPLFVDALTTLTVSLARQMAADGEGATKLVTVKIVGAASDDDALAAAKSVANSPLVKTAIAGHDANWGRLAVALGKSPAVFRQEDVSIWFMGLEVCRGGLAVEFDEAEALRRFEADEIEIVADLGTGAGASTVWTCDLTHDYISINADYRT